MTNDPIEKILSSIQALRQKMAIIKPTLGSKILLVGILLLIIGYNLFFVYVQDHRHQPID